MRILDRSLAPRFQPRPLRILQLGTGVFLRGFVDWMVQRMNEAGVFDGGVAVAKLTAGGGIDVFERQQGCFTHLIRDRNVQSRLIVDCIRDWVQPHSDWQRFLALAGTDSLRFVFSNSTEAGIAYQHCPRPERAASSFPAKLAAWLHARFSAFGGDVTKGVVVVPCELIENNGSLLRDLVLRHARDWSLGTEFEDWLSRATTFVDTLVDRIVAAPGAGERRSFEREVGYRDDLLNASESYHLLVIAGGSEHAAELPLHEAGLQVVWTDQLQPYRERKVRILNGAHVCLALLGPVLGCSTVLECMEHAELRAFLERCIRDEIVPALATDAGPLAEPLLRTYAAETLQRLANPHLEHRLADIRRNLRAKLRIRLLPSIRDFVVRSHGLPPGLVTVVAACLREDPGAVDDWPPLEGLAAAIARVPLADGPLAAIRATW